MVEAYFLVLGIVFGTFFLFGLLMVKGAPEIPVEDIEPDPPPPMDTSNSRFANDWHFPQQTSSSQNQSLEIPSVAPRGRDNVDDTRLPDSFTNRPRAQSLSDMLPHYDSVVNPRIAQRRRFPSLFPGSSISFPRVVNAPALVELPPPPTPPPTYEDAVRINIEFPRV